jgi:glycosyltransferase involved in cell wall biosynthesis
MTSSPDLPLEPADDNGLRIGAASEAVPVSVVIPCYRARATIGRAIASVAAQTRRPLEVIVVDDASGDDTPDELKRLAERYGRDWLKILAFDQNRGVSEARNAGIDLAKGAYVAFLDADDTWYPFKLDVQYRYMAADPQIAMTGHLHDLRTDGEPVDCVPPVAVRADPIGNASVLMKNPFVTPSVMIRADAGVRFLPVRRYMEDHLAWQITVLSGQRVERLRHIMASIYKPPVVATGLSSHLLAMERAELGNYLHLARIGYISPVLVPLLQAYSLAKFVRRLLLVAISRRRRP